jgi:hypothetical protein
LLVEQHVAGVGHEVQARRGAGLERAPLCGSQTDLVVLTEDDLGLSA